MAMYRLTSNANLRNVDYPFSVFCLLHYLLEDPTAPTVFGLDELTKVAALYNTGNLSEKEIGESISTSLAVLQAAGYIEKIPNPPASHHIAI